LQIGKLRFRFLGGRLVVVGNCDDADAALGEIFVTIVEPTELNLAYASPVAAKEDHDRVLPVLQ
jgi:hypothetical protein